MSSSDFIDLTGSDDEDWVDGGVIDLTFDDDDDGDRKHDQSFEDQQTTSNNGVAKQKKYQRRASSLVKSTNSMLQSFRSNGIKAIETEIAVVRTEKFLDFRADLIQNNKSDHVSILYHFSPVKDLNVNRINDSEYVSILFGREIYTATNPFALPERGSHFLMLAVLRGNEKEAILDNVDAESPFQDVIVLGKGCQALPLVQFDRRKIYKDTQLSDSVWSVHEKLQGILDTYFNDSVSTPLTRIFPSIRGPFGRVSYEAPKTLFQKENYFRRIDDKPNETEECCMCLEKLTAGVVRPNVCSHRIHEKCLDDYFGDECPQCRRSIKEPRGRSPSGHMQVWTKLRDCAGYEGGGAIAIKFKIPNGSQLCYHPAPDCPFSGIPVYGPSIIPNTNHGRQLLKRIEYAFKRGLCFDVTDGKDKEGIHEARIAGHLTSLPTAYDSWSDKLFQKCNEELDALRVPDANVLEHSSSIVYSGIREYLRF